MAAKDKSKTKQVAAPRTITVDPKVLAAVKAAKPFRPEVWRPLLKMLLFHLYFLPTSLLFLPLILLRSLIPALRPNPNIGVLSAAAIFNVRRVVRSFIRFRLQPIQPREGGLRDRGGVIGTTLNVLNLSAPGGNVSAPKLAIKSASSSSSSRSSLDKVWFDPPPLELFNDLISIKVDSANSSSSHVNSKYYTGPALVDPKWAKSRISGFWFMHKSGILPATTLTKQDRPVILYFHGGAGVTFSAADAFMGQGLTKNLALTTGVDVFSVEYILAPYSTFPVPLVHALAGYLYLHRKLGYRPDQIYIGGDSFGAWLTLQLERYLRLNAALVFQDPESQPATFIPGLILLSPWLDSHGNERWPSREKFHLVDIVDIEYGNWGMDSLRITEKHHSFNPLVEGNIWYTPLNRSTDELLLLPPVFIANGGYEVLLDEGLYMADQIRKAKNLPPASPNDFTTPQKIKFPQAQVVSHVTPYMAHDFFTLPTEIQHSRNVYNLIGTWINQIQSTPSPYSI